MLTDTSQKHDGDGVTDSGTHTVYHALNKAVAGLHVGDRHTEHRTVGGDQRKEHAQRVVEGYHTFLEEHLYDLHQSRNYKDEHDRL